MYLYDLEMLQNKPMGLWLQSLPEINSPFICTVHTSTVAFLSCAQNAWH